MISLVLTHHNRLQLLLESFAAVKEDPRIKEIVISDDCSDDGSWEKLQKRFNADPKVKLFRNERNLDCYRNKAKALERASQKWCILLDSDNVIDKNYVDTICKINRCGNGWRKGEAYLPVFAQPHFNYTHFAGCVITAKNVSRYLDQPHFQTALNTANFFVHRDDYLAAFDPSVDPHTADSIYMNYRMLAQGSSLVFVNGLQYFHRVHDGSHYKKNVHKTGGFAKFVEAKLRAL